MCKKLTYEFVKASFEGDGYTLLSTGYKNNHTKLKYKCSKGHVHSIVWRNWQRGDRCPYCDGQAKPPFEYVRKQFELEGYVLLSTNYINNKTKLDYICPNGHRHDVTWSEWNNGGVRCLFCSNRSPIDFDNIKQAFTLENYTLLTGKYKNNNTKLNYSCPYGHEHSITWANWVTGYRCPTCANINRTGPGHHNWQGGKTLEEYCGVWKDKEYRQDIRDRDGNRCLNPYCTSPNKKDLTIHHINYIKGECGLNNLITVCRSCNSRANYNRRWHTKWYQAIMYRRYGYEYK